MEEENTTKTYNRRGKVNNDDEAENDFHEPNEY